MASQDFHFEGPIVGFGTMDGPRTHQKQIFYFRDSAESF
jgi:hypothetical protein